MSFGSLPAARPQLMRALNERALIDHIRRSAPVSRAELGRVSGLSKPTVALALANLERDGLIRSAGRRSGTRGPAAAVYETRPDAGYVLGLDVGREYLRGAVADLAGTVRARGELGAHDGSAPVRVDRLERLADTLLTEAGLRRSQLTQTVIGGPGVYDPARRAIRMAATLPGWERPEVLSRLREMFGASLAIENDVNLAAVAEQVYGHGQGTSSLAFVSVGTGIGVGLIVDGRLHRGVHGAAGEVAWLPLAGDPAGSVGPGRPGRPGPTGTLEQATSAAGVVAAARSAGLRGRVTARRVFDAAERGDPAARAVVDREAGLVAQALAIVVAVADPELVVLGGGIGRAPGFAAAVTGALARFAPVAPTVRVSALGADAVVAGCLAAGLDRAWDRLTAPG